MKKKRILALTLGILFCLAMPFGVSASEPVSSTGLPYESYVYNNDNEPVLIPAPYSVDYTISAEDIDENLSEFAALSDIFYDGIDRLYLADSGNNRIVITDKQFHLIQVLEGFDNGGVWETFSSPASVYANAESIYIADSANGRIVVLDRETWQLDRVLGRPDIPQLADDYVYTPTQLTVDHSGRIYVIADGINRGMIRLEPDGTFTTFFGAPSVDYNIFDLLWRKFATKEQRKQMEQYVPTEYTSLLMDKKGFIYVVSETSQTTPIAKLNSKGDNVLNGLSGEDENWGDVSYLKESGEIAATYFSDVCISGTDTYTILDSRQGKVYVYTSDGYLLYVFGGSGFQKGVFHSANSIEQIDDLLVVADGTKGTVTIFNFTDFGRTVQDAVRSYNDGDYELSEQQWNQVYGYCSNYTPAITGLGKIRIAQGEYKEAMDSLKDVHAYKMYCKAFKANRDVAIRKYFVPACVGIIALFVLYIVLKKQFVKTACYRKYVESDFHKKQKYATYAMFHPFDAHWDIKHEKRGDLKTAMQILIAFVVCYAIRAQFSGYVVTKQIREDVNVPLQVLAVLLLIGFCMIANWCFTTLMSGKGTMKDIVIAICYSLKPYVLLSPILFVMTHVLTVDEALAYTVLDTVSLIWVLGLIFISLLTIHDYTFGKSILSTILTLLGMCIILFLLLLVTSLVQEIWGWFEGIYKELIFRTY